jgi:hypothetical protein
MPNFGGLSFPPNVGLADLSGVGKIFYALRYRFLPIEFADLCTLIDEIVLRDHIVLVGKRATTPQKYQDAIAQLVNAGVFRLQLESTAIQRIARPPQALIEASHAASVRGLTVATVIDADLEVTRLLGAEAQLKIPATVLLRNLHHFGVARRPRFEHAICDLVHRNKKLAEDAAYLHTEIQTYGPPLRGFIGVNVPPLAFSVLQRAHSFEQLIERILDLRTELVELRADALALHEQLSDPTVTVEKQKDLLRTWDRKWRKSWDDATANRVLIANTSVGLLARGATLVRALGTHAWGDAFMQGVRALKDLHEAESTRALRQLHTPVRNYLLSSREQMSASVSRIFETDPAKIDRLMKQLAAPNSLWRNAFRYEQP